MIESSKFWSDAEAHALSAQVCMSDHVIGRISPMAVVRAIGHVFITHDALSGAQRSLQGNPNSTLRQQFACDDCGEAVTEFLCSAWGRATFMLLSTEMRDLRLVCSVEVQGGGDFSGPCDSADCSQSRKWGVGEVCS